MDIDIRKEFAPYFADPSDLNIIALASYTPRASVVTLTSSGKHRAIKKTKIAKDFQYNKEPARRCLREIKLLAHFRGHENIISLFEVRQNKDRSSGILEVYSVLEGMTCNLKDFIESEGVVNSDAIQSIPHQTLCGLKFIHSAGVIHRDIRSKNILLDKSRTSWRAKICSFGLAFPSSRGLAFPSDRGITGESDPKDMKWYRSPERSTGIGAGNYTSAIDIWGFGCVLAELLLGFPIFKDGKGNKADPLHSMHKYLGTPSEKDLDEMTFDARKILDPPDKQKRSSAPFRDVPPKEWPENEQLAASALLTGLLVLDPIRRNSCDEALEHYYFKGINNKGYYCKESFDFLFETEPTGPIDSLIKSTIAQYQPYTETTYAQAEKTIATPPLPTPGCHMPLPQLGRLEEGQFIRPYQESWNLTGTGKIMHIGGQIGHGSFAYVHQGTYQHTEGTPLQVVAIKQFKSTNSLEDNAKIALQLYREAGISSILKHQNIARFVGYIFDKNNQTLSTTAQLVSDYYENGNLTDYLEMSTNNPDRNQLCVDILQGLEYLHTHQKQIVHGDIKPDNILIDIHGRALLADFGLSSAILDLYPSGLTMTRTEGAVRYLSPELIPSLKLTVSPPPRTLEGDIWAFGCVCLYVHHGVKPYKDYATLAVAQQILQGEVPHSFHNQSFWESRMIECWNRLPKDRPSVSNIIENFSRQSQISDT